VKGERGSAFGSRRACRLLAVTVLALMAACAAPVTDAGDPFTGFDRGEYRILREHARGFTLAVVYSRHQFHPDTAAVTAACRHMLTTIAGEVADLRGSRIKPLDQSLIKLSVRRNSSRNVTSCLGTVPVEFAE
jgi:hypothetical protein